MNTDNMYDVLPGEEDFEEEKGASPQETPPQPTRQGLAGERSPSTRPDQSAVSEQDEQERQSLFQLAPRIHGLGTDSPTD